MSGTISLNDRLQSEVKELASSINTIVDKFKELHHPLAESHEKVPKATLQLDKISEQTEMATHQMLDTVEQITEREQRVIDGVNKIKARAKKKEFSEIINLADELAGLADQNVNDAYKIMDSLQFQDITSQQMNHAASLLEDIEIKLREIISVVDGSGDSEDGIREKKTRAYDPHADMVDRKTDQGDIDNIFSKQSDGE